MLFIGKNSAEAIDWVQETLGPITPRNVAEDTYRVLCAEGLVDVDLDCIIILEEMGTEDLRQRARNTIMTQANQRAGVRRVLGRRASAGRARHAAHKMMQKQSRHSRVTDNSADATNRRKDFDDDQD